MNNPTIAIIGAGPAGLSMARALQKAQLSFIIYEKHCKTGGLWDEPVSSGGQDSGPDPYTTLLASLAGCTLATLRMYIDRKGWNIPEISVTLNLSQNQDNGLTTTIKRDIFFGEGIEHQVRERLLVIATKCPVSKILENKIIIQTTA